MHSQWCRKVSDRWIWLTKFHLDWQKINISGIYFIVRTLWRWEPDRRSNFFWQSAWKSLCRHIYDWNIVNCDIKQLIQLIQTNYCSDWQNVQNQSKWLACPKKFQHLCIQIFSLLSLWDQYKGSKFEQDAASAFASVYT